MGQITQKSGQDLTFTDNAFAQGTCVESCYYRLGYTAHKLRPHGTKNWIAANSYSTLFQEMIPYRILRLVNRGHYFTALSVITTHSCLLFNFISCGFSRFNYCNTLSCVFGGSFRFTAYKETLNQFKKL